MWVNEKFKAVIEIGSDDHITQMIVETHKSFYKWCKLFSDKMFEKGFRRTVDQCGIKVKRLRQQYEYFVPELSFQ